MTAILANLNVVNAVDLEIRTDDSEWKGFTNIAVFRSQTGQEGPYDPISNDIWTEATLPVGAFVPVEEEVGRSVNVVGKTLDILVDQAHAVSVSFTGTDPLTYAECATQIDSSVVAAWVTEDGKLAVASCRLGGGSSISVTGDAAPILELPVGETVFGMDPHPVLHKNCRVYGFRDYYGSSSFWYKTRFVNLSTGAVSDFSVPVLGGSKDNLPPSSLSVGYLKVVDVRGKAQKNVRVVVSMDAQLVDVAEGCMVSGAPVEKLTDENGLVEFVLIKGLKVTVVVPDMGMVRKITVPDEPRFNLTASGIGEYDPYEVKRISIAYGERRNF